MPPPHPRIAATALIGAAAWFGPGTAVHWPPVARALRVPLSLPELPGVAITFDDGPHPEGTPAVLAALARERATATFFLVGEQVERYPALAAEIAAAGHGCAVHGHRHRNQMRLTPRAFAEDLDRAVSVIGETCGPPRRYRPPYGVFTLPGLATVRRAGLEPLLWSKWGRDWRGRTTPAEIVALAVRDLSPGDVVLLHDADWYAHRGSHRNTAAAVPAILTELRRLGLDAVTP